MRSRVLMLLVFFWICPAGCGPSDPPAETAPRELLLYCGITMVRPMSEISRIIEKEQNCRIHMTQGGSEDLYQSLKAARRGDLYLAGSAAYRERHLDEGLLGDYVHVGYNQAALVVATGNPEKVKPELGQLLREDLGVVICNPDSGSIGRETRVILTRGGIYDAVFKRSVYLTTDSRNLNNALKAGEADVVINWRATAFFPDNAPHLEVIDLPAGVAVPKALLLNLLTFAEHPEIARRFMAYAASPDGQAIFRKHGFMDNSSGAP